MATRLCNKRRTCSADKIDRSVRRCEKTRSNDRGSAGGKTRREEKIRQRRTGLRLPSSMRSLRRVRVEGVCGHIKRGAFADLRLGRSSENHINFEVLKSMGRLRNQMKRTVGFVICDRGMVIDRELTIQVRGKNSVDCPPMHVTCCPVAMVGLGMDMHQWRGEHPTGCPYENEDPNVMYQSHRKFSLAQLVSSPQSILVKGEPAHTFLSKLQLKYEHSCTSISDKNALTVLIDSHSCASRQYAVEVVNFVGLTYFFAACASSFRLQCGSRAP